MHLALGLCGEFAAGQRHGFESTLLAEGRFVIRLLGFGGWIRRFSSCRRSVPLLVSHVPNLTPLGLVSQRNNLFLRRRKFPSRDSRSRCWKPESRCSHCPG